MRKLVIPPLIAGAVAIIFLLLPSIRGADPRTAPGW